MRKIKLIRFLIKNHNSLLIALFGFSFGIGILCVIIPLPNDGNVIGLMLTLLSVIVTLGVAYSFYSIYRANTEVSEIKRDFEKLSNQFLSLKVALQKDVNDNYQDMKKYCDTLEDKFRTKSDKLSEDTAQLKAARIFEKQNKEAEGKFRDGSYLLAIKVELEAIEYLLNNLNVLMHELVSSTGNKRANISRDICCFFENISEQEFNKMSDFKDSYETIICKKENIIHSTGWSSISVYERERYTFLFDVISKLIQQLMLRKFPIPISKDNEVTMKLYFYQTYLQGDKSDIDNGWAGWKNNYLLQNQMTPNVYL